ncbi:PEP/pyruvate-binding domain-containing protein [bacterium]|nr:PEP/pyruvate-binding domain-containing protein [bacterium]
MTESHKFSRSSDVTRFNRNFFDSSDVLTCIGSGEFGGKASGLMFIHDTLANGIRHEDFPDITINIPRFCVLTTDVFDAFMQRNNLYSVALSDMPDDRIAHAFQKTEFPAAHIGDLMGLISKVRQPLAVRSSSLLEDALYHPFAGVYGTKMIPNNQFDVDTRFRKLVEAIKFVYASVFFQEAKAYIATTGQKIENEKMAVIIQEVVGERHGNRFYPHVSGVARSYNFYPAGRAKPEQGVVDLALGLGKTIVDGGMCWTYSPALPKVNPPFGSMRDLLRQTQVEFWAVNMGKPPAFDPIKETEYMIKPGLAEAEEDETLRFVASTYNAESDRLSPGTGMAGPRAITFAPILQLNDVPLNKLLKVLLKLCEEKIGDPVEIEFAMTLDKTHGLPARFGFLQVRPMVVSNERVEIDSNLMTGETVLAASESVLGNGTVNSIQDVVYVRPSTFDKKYTRAIVEEIAGLNRQLAEEGRPYLLVGFGRWGSSDPWLGIPVNWSQISAAKAIVEATLPDMNVDLSQGSHFFHNLSSFQVSYFSMHHDSNYKIKWEWLEQQEKIAETKYVRHVRLSSPLQIMVDGRTGKGMISYE